MTGLEFFTDLAVTGTVLGLDHTSTVAEVEAVFELTPCLDVPELAGHRRWSGGVRLAAVARG